MAVLAFNLGKEINNKKVLYRLHQPLWTINLEGLDMSKENWITIKYLNDVGTGLNDQIANVPNNRGGIYMFQIFSPIIPGITEFPVYIGRVQLTDHQNLRKRVREYFKDERPQIEKMINTWGNELYLSYMILDDNQKIIDLEEKLINSLLLPFNDKIPDKQIYAAIKAFQE